MDKLRILRQRKGYTQIKVQMETGIDQSNYSKIERGLKEPTFQECRSLALLFETSMDYIADLTDTEIPYPRKPRNTHIKR